MSRAKHKKTYKTGKKTHTGSQRRVKGNPWRARWRYQNLMQTKKRCKIYNTYTQKRIFQANPEAGGLKYLSAEGPEGVRNDGKQAENRRMSVKKSREKAKNRERP
jgi:hypothetical protein